MGDAEMGDGDGRAERFAALATQAKLSPALAADATALLDELTPSLAAYNESEEGLQPLAERALFTLVLFCAKAHYAGPEPTPSLSDLSSFTDVSLMEVFRVLPPFLAYASTPLRLRYGEGVEARLRVNPLRRGLAFSFVLAEKYRRLFRAVLTTATGSTARTPVRPGPGGAPAASAEDVSQDALCRFGWYLFCFAKLHLVDADADLNHLVDILVAVLVVLVAHAPVERRLFALGDVAVYPHRREDSSPDIVLALTTLAKSSASSCADYLEQVLKLVPQLGDAAVPAGPASEAAAGSLCFPGLLEPGRLAAAADVASRAYIDASRSAGEEIDQRLFLRESTGSGAGGGGSSAPLDPSQLTPRRRTHGGSMLAQHGRATPAPMRNISALLASPLRPTAAASAATPGAQLAGLRSPPAGGPAPRSPISRMFVSAQWLRQVASAFVPTDPQPQLMRYIVVASAEPAAMYDAMLAQAQRYAHLLFPSPPPAAPAVVPLQLAAAGRGNHVTPTRFSARAGAAPDRPSLIEELAANAAALATNQTAAAESRRAQSVALYFRMLPRILAREEQKLTGAAPPPQPNGASAQPPGAPPAPGSPAPPAAPPPDFGAMLRTERMHRGLFSVCADCVADAMHVTSWHFPAFQHQLQVLPFEAVNLVGMVSDSDRELPYELKRSLNSMLDQLLERLVWERGSGFYAHLVRDVGAQPAQPAAADAPPSAVMSSGGTATTTGVSGTAGGERVLLPLRYGTVAASLQAGSVRTHCSLVLARVHRMLSRRLMGITERLASLMPNALRDAVHGLLLTLLFEHTSLFYGRHADSILICTIYGCAKASSWPRVDAPLMFREIVGAYRALVISDTGAPPDEALWRAIPITFSGAPGDPALEVTRHDDLVRFYNEVFLKTVKPAMLAAVRMAGLMPEARRDHDAGGAPPPASPARAAAAAGNGAAAPGRARAAAAAAAAGTHAEPAAAQRAPFAVLLSASPRRMSVASGGGGGVLVSPMRPDRAAELRASTAAPRALYAFVGDSISALTSPSHDLDRFNDALRTAAQRGAEGADAAAGDAPPSAGRDRRRTLTRTELPPPTRRRISEL